VSSTRVFAQNFHTVPGAEPTPAFVSEIDDDGPLMEPRHVRLGMTPTEVLYSMKGKPDAKLAPDVWVYWGFHARLPRAEQKFNTLVIVFEEGRVQKYKLSERKSVVALMEQLRQLPAHTQVAGKK
jgi:hypothetical protein